MTVFLVYVQLKNADLDRTAEFGKEFVDIMTSLSGGKCTLAFRSSTFDTFGYFIKTPKHENQVRSALDTMQETRTGDSIMVMEVGKKFTAVGGSTAWTWLQHNLDQ